MEEENESTSQRIPKIFDRFYSSSSSSEEEELHNTSETAGKRLDNMIQFLDRRLENDDSNDIYPLPEFTASGGGQGIFKRPDAAPRPPCLQLRPRPLTETQIGRFFRTLVSVDDSELWVASEDGVRVWSFGDVYKASPAPYNQLYGDEETAPFSQSVTSAPTLCLLAHDASRMVWTGHKDGRIRCWKLFTDHHHRSRSLFKELFSWQAHRTPILSMFLTLYEEGVGSRSKI